MKKRIVIPAVILVAVVLIAIAKRPRPEQLSFLSTEVVRGDIVNTISATGTIQPVEKVEVGTQVSGTIENVLVDFNDPVKAGDVIAILDKRVLTLQVNQAVANFRAAQSELNYRKAYFERVSQLHEKQMTTDEEFEQSQYNYERAKASLESARVDKARAQTNLGYATITSPIDGVVLSRAIDEGQTVAASFNTPTLFTIAKDLTAMEVQADIDEADIGQIRVGQTVEFSVDTWPDTLFSGIVSQIRLEPTVESNVVTYPVIITATNENRKLFPGMTATVTITTSGVTDVLTIPTKALRFKPDFVPNDVKEKKGSLVWIERGDRLEPISIKTGERNATRVEVTAGLSEGDRVVTGTQSNGSKTTTTGVNPFMPRRPGSRSSNNRSSNGGRR